MDTKDDKNFKALENIHEYEGILSQYPAPEPGEELIADIKVKIAKALQHKSVFRRRVYKMAAVAAAVIMVAAISLLFEKGGGEPEKVIYASIIPAAIWESTDLAADDAELATLTAEIEETEHQILSVQFDQGNGNGDKALVELEAELIEINSDFWKG